MEAKVKSLRRAEIRPPGSELTSSHSCPWEELGGSSTLVCCWWHTPSTGSPVYDGHRSRQAPSEFLVLSSELKSLLSTQASIDPWQLYLVPSWLQEDNGIHQLSGRGAHPHVWSWTTLVFPSVQFSHSVVSDSLWPHELQDARLPCPSPIPRAYSNSCPSHWWCHPAISSSVVPFSHCQSSPASGSFPVSQFFTSGGQSIGSFSFSISPFDEYSGLISFRMDWLDLAVQVTLKSLLQHHGSKASDLPRSAFLIVQLSHPYMTTGKTIALTRQTFVGKVMSLHYNMLFRFSLIGALSIYLYFWLRFFS